MVVRGWASTRPWCGTDCIAAPQSQFLERAHIDRAAERARLAESHVVDQNNQHIRSVGRCIDLERAGGMAGSCGLPALLRLRRQLARGLFPCGAPSQEPSKAVASAAFAVEMNRLRRFMFRASLTA